MHIDARQEFVKDEHVGLRGEASGNDRALLAADGRLTSRSATLLGRPI